MFSSDRWCILILVILSFISFFLLWEQPAFGQPVLQQQPEAADACDPSPPQSFEIVEAGNSSVTIRWEDLGASRYRIPFELRGFREKFFIESETNEVTIDQLEPGMDYRMWVYTFCGNEKSERSDVFYFSTTGEAICQPPSITNIDTLSETSVRVVWEDLEVSSYEVRLRKATQDGKSFQADFFETEDNSLVLEGLEKDTKYWVWIRSFCDYQYAPSSDWTERRVFSLNINDCGGQDSAAFQLVNAEEESLSIRFKEANRFFGGETHYSLKMQTIGTQETETLNPGDDRIQVHTAPDGWAEWTISGLVIGQEYSFEALYWCSSEDTYVSASAVFSTSGTCPTAFSTGASVTSSTATLQWENPTYTVEKVSVLLKVQGADQWEYRQDLSQGQQQLQFSDLQPGTTYTYEIRHHCLADINYGSTTGTFSTESFQSMLGHYLTDLKFYPVPVTDELNLLAVAIQDVPCTITIDYMSGKRLIHKKLQLSEGYNENVVDMRSAKPGAYYLRMYIHEDVIRATILVR